MVIHELCHLEHMNHGPGFQALMSQCLPDWRDRKRELNEMLLR
ncbi:MAG: M48 family metallopeptidase [Alcanivoracaceae bacterium]|nr:M48 family metallopeptidase [Alcanivoracaceae bacterium]